MDVHIAAEQAIGNAEGHLKVYRFVGSTLKIQSMYTDQEV